MKQNLMLLDGVAYDLQIVSLQRSFQVLDTDYSGRVIEAGQMYRDVVGTFYNYELKVKPSRRNPQDYDAFYEAISSPQESHILTLPYGSGGALTQKMYVTAGKDDLIRQENGKNLWDGLSVSYVATRAARVPE